MESVFDAARKVQLLSCLDNEELWTFLLYADVEERDEGGVFVRRGEHAGSMFILLKGKTRVRLIRQGKERVLVTLSAGEFFGQSGLIEDCAYSADAVANEKTIALRLDSDALDRMRKEEPVIAAAFLKALRRIC